MKHLLILLVLVVGSVCAGCSCGGASRSEYGCPTLVESRQERNTRIADICNLQARMLVEDWDYLWLAERNSYLTQWHPRVGI